MSRELQGEAVLHDVHGPPESRRATVGQAPSRREGTEADVAGAVFNLASGRSSFLAGEAVEVNGGAAVF